METTTTTSVTGQITLIEAKTLIPIKVELVRDNNTAKLFLSSDFNGYKCLDVIIKGGIFSDSSKSYEENLEEAYLEAKEKWNIGLSSIKAA